MPIIEPNSPLNSLRSELQNVVAHYSPDMLEKVLQEMGMLPSTVLPTSNNPTYKEACEFFLTSADFLGTSKSTKKTYTSELNQFSNYVKTGLGTMALLRDISSPQFLLSYLKNALHVNTKSKKSAFLRTFLKVTLKEYFKESLDDLDLKKVLKIRWKRGSENEVDSLPRPLNKAQLSEVTTLAAASSKGLRNHAIVMTFLTSGIRLNELINLQIEDLNTDKCLLSVIPKGDEHVKRLRNINLLGVSILQNYISFTYASHKRRLPQDDYKKLYIFSANNGKTPLDPKTVETFVSSVYDQCTTIPKIHDGRRKLYNVHTFRHCYAVYGLEGGLDIYTISKLLGHKDIKSTAIYLDLFNDQLSKAVEQHPFAKKVGDD
ncbi:tyrosine-type recombinase/integrase [Paenibacillus anseongense]|uniref:tyrosine-type recombinase/integrase n=1 Tax=Paenibacillus anseongense TaxID=2682845 RepID=UPI002DB824EB|nr:tyrosine-type recombinase/integrase [Paenibacillus anseongense]MEC0269700.1 tyrosine-type recombinase/integrase [Paenibacillus anseongense]